jgi:C4-dicarboxylate-specific signal transduction histidine kinase
MVDVFNERDIKNRKINFNITKRGDKVVLDICDNGGGISNEVIDNIFEARFTTKEKGSGMGLYLSKMIINKIDGEIIAENIKNGAKFSIYLKENDGK